MYTCSVATLRSGMVLGKTLYNEQGTVLLVAGTSLTDTYITALRQRGVTAVYIDDGMADDLVPDTVVSEQVRATMVGHLATMFEGIGRLAGDFGVAEAGQGGTVDDAIRALGPKPAKLDEKAEQALDVLYDDIDRLMTEILEGDTLGTLESLKSHNAYTFEHSVEVAIIGILLGKHAGLESGQMRELALGCLLHDIGKRYIDEAVLDKPGKLDAAEWEQVRQHPTMGFELVRRMPVFSIIPAHVALQHHERQDGAGYPRGLRGSNKLVRSSIERLHPNRILMLAEIAAVADVYSATASDRPYRPAMSSDDVRDLLKRMAGTHLNREVVLLLIDKIPPYSVGRWVRITTGSHEGWRGVVSDVDRRRPELPVVRLLLDEHGDDVTPIEIDLRKDPDVGIRSLAPGETPRLGT